MNTLNKLLVEANKVTMKDLKIDKKLFNKPKLSKKSKTKTSKKSKTKTSKKSKTKTSKKSKKN